MTPRLDDSGIGDSRRSTGRGRTAIHPRPPRRALAGRSLGGPAVAIGIAIAIAAWFGPQPARASSAQAPDGEQLYAQHCASCHQPGGLGLEGAFPPLAGNPAAADEVYVATVIRDGLSGPLEVLGVSYDAAMPPVAGLTDPEIEEVASYVAALAGPADATEDDPATGPDPDDAAATNEAVTGDVERGEDLFLGAASFENGGAACAACHTAGSVGNLGGQSLGPDLTDIFDTLGGEIGLTGWMANPPSPTMQPLFADRPLTDAEVADVVAFLGDTPNQDPDTGFDRLLVAGLGGLAVLVAGMAVFWRGMRQTYRDRLLARPGPRQRRPGSASIRQTPTSAGRHRQAAGAGRSDR